MGGGEGAAHARVRGAPLTCPYYQDANRSDCVYEDALFTRYVLEVIGQHAEVQGTSTPLFFFWAPHSRWAAAAAATSYVLYYL